MAIRMVIKKSRLKGQGTDVSGPFEMSGEYDSASQIVTIEKRYPWLTVDYCGTWDGQMISGEWSISDGGEGIFEMWPDDPALTLESAHAQKALPAPG